MEVQLTESGFAQHVMMLMTVDVLLRLDEISRSTWTLGKFHIA